MPELVFDSVTVKYPPRGGGVGEQVLAVHDVSLTVPAGGSLGIAGESGSGKTTLAMAALRLLPRQARTSGRVLIGDRDVLTLRWGELRTLRWSEAAIVFQGAMHSLNPVRRVGQQIDEALRLHPGTKYRSASARQARIAELFTEVDLPTSRMKSYPHELSGGQKQRVMIAMAMACAPDIIIADEPTTALDVVVQAQILDLLKALVRENGISLMMITHDLSVLATTCAQTAVMQNGRIVETGSSADLMTNPQHPHTRDLAGAFPVIGDLSSRLNPTTRHQAVAEHSPAAPFVSATSEPLLEARGVSVGFRARTGYVAAVRDVSLACRAGEIVALVGQSGSGKTTLARTLLGLQPCVSGEIVYRGRALPHRVRRLKQYRRRVQLVLQDPTGALNPKHTVYESVAEGIRIHRLGGDEQQRVADALARAELNPPEDFFAALPSQLSGGQRQRVVIAGALALEPEFLVADEPVASLDASARGEILALLLRLKTTLGLGALVITHDLGLAWNIADRVEVMYQGQIVESGPVEQVLVNPRHDYTRRLLAAVPQLPSRRTDNQRGSAQ